jgi:rare lipoprotein A
MNKIIIVLAALLLAACGTTPQRQTAIQPEPITDHTAVAQPASTPGSGGYLAGDGPDDHPPANIDAIPDAVPVAEPLHRYANRPYVALDKTYRPLSQPGNFKQRGIASWYGKKFNGQRTASGEKYDMYAMTAAHPTLPIPSYARVTNVATGKSVVVRINDRGPFLHDRAIDLSYTAAHKLGIVGHGSQEVEIESLVANSYPSVRDEVATAPEQNATAAAVTSTPLPADAPQGNIFLQLGAFNTLAAAEQFLSEMKAKLGDAGKGLVLLTQDNKTRVRIGPYASLADARSRRDSLKDKLGFLPMLSVH